MVDGWKKKVKTFTSILQGLLNFGILWLRQKQNKQQKMHQNWGKDPSKASRLTTVTKQNWTVVVDGKVATHRFLSTFCAGHAWRSPGTAPLCLARCALPTLPPDTGHKVGHAWQHSTGTSPPCPVQCALLTPPDTGQKAGHAWHNPGTSPTCSAQCALPTPPPDTGQNAGHA